MGSRVGERSYCILHLTRMSGEAPGGDHVGETLAELFVARRVLDGERVGDGAVRVDRIRDPDLAVNPAGRAKAAREEMVAGGGELVRLALEVEAGRSRGGGGVVVARIGHGTTRLGCRAAWLLRRAGRGRRAGLRR